ncbi:hypothetical protein GLOIN_2v1766462 [Rhizophagus irregularis DAOM 181602=DAOM 197198]|nr:hypothetical protein GLOIN_2v1766462 [Rhizophagus irregularis DAOM 181602=DAOM 197198]
MSNNIKDNKVSLSLSDNDNIKISEALSFIHRLMIDLKDNNYYENLEEKLEALKAENNNLLSELKNIEVVKINVDNKNEVDEDVEIMEIDVENDDIQNEETEDKAKKNLEAKELKEKKFKKFGEKLRKLVMDDLQSNTHDSPVQKLADKDMVNESDLQNNNLTHSLNLLTAEPIKIIDKTSGIQRVKQWASKRTK